ncbi:hypothetical protein [Streptomyces sp. NPDC055094]
MLAATRIATDAAIAVLARYRSHHGLRVRGELVRAWAELHAISSYGGRARIKISGEFTTAEFSNGCRTERLTHLWVATDIGKCWRWLREFPQPRFLTIETPLPPWM